MLRVSFSPPWVCWRWLLEPLFFDPPRHQEHSCSYCSCCCRFSSIFFLLEYMLHQCWGQFRLGFYTMFGDVGTIVASLFQVLISHRFFLILIEFDPFDPHNVLFFNGKTILFAKENIAYISFRGRCSTHCFQDHFYTFVDTFSAATFASICTSIFGSWLHFGTLGPPFGAKQNQSGAQDLPNGSQWIGA